MPSTDPHARVNRVRYRTIVADPPWDHSDGTGVDLRRGTITSLPYPVMSLEEIASLPIGDLADRQAHLYLWTTTRYLEPAFGIVRGWRFDPIAVLVWCKPPRGWMVGGTYASNVEFVMFGTRNDGGADAVALGSWLRAQREAAGLRQKDVAAHWPSRTGGITGCVANWELGFNAPTGDQWEQLRAIIGFGHEMDEFMVRVNAAKGEPLARGSSPTRWFNWPRGDHSAKPEAFLDMVETVSPAPRLEMFARRQRLGWDTWGDQALEHVEMATRQ